MEYRRNLEVRIFEKDESGNDVEAKWRKGYFLAWAQTTEFIDSGESFIIPVAIVELEDGYVTLSNTYNMRFTKL